MPHSQNIATATINKEGTDVLNKIKVDFLQTEQATAKQQKVFLGN